MKELKIVTKYAQRHLARNRLIRAYWRDWNTLLLKQMRQDGIKTPCDWNVVGVIYLLITDTANYVKAPALTT